MALSEKVEEGCRGTVRCNPPHLLCHINFFDIAAGLMMKNFKIWLGTCGGGVAWDWAAHLSVFGLSTSSSYNHYHYTYKIIIKQVKV